MSLISNKVFVAAPILLLLVAPLPAVADEAEDEFHRFSVSAGMFFTDRQSKTRVRGNLGEGTNVDLEGDLGLDRNDVVFRLDSYFRFNERHRIDLSVFDLSRDKKRVIEEEIEWGDTVYPINARIKAEFDLTIYKLAYTWSFMRRERGYLGLTGGLYIASFGASLSEAQLGSVESDNLTAPLPVVGLRGEYDLADKWKLRASAELFALEYEEYDGSLVDFYAGVDYQLWEHAAVGLGINSVTIDVGIDRPRFDGELNWKYDGALLFVKFDF